MCTRDESVHRPRHHSLSVSTNRYKSIEHQVSSDWLQWITRGAVVLLRNRTLRADRREGKLESILENRSSTPSDRLGKYLQSQWSRNQCQSEEDQSRAHWWMASSNEVLGEATLAKSKRDLRFDGVEQQWIVSRLTLIKWHLAKMNPIEKRRNQSW